MKVLRLKDRLDDSELPITGAHSLINDRWFVQQSVTCNGHTSLVPGDLLFDDGANRLVLNLVEIEFSRPQLDHTDLADYRVALDALTSIDAKSDLSNGCWPSPLLPAELGHESKSTELDILLDIVFERGHLDAIAASPRLNVRYDTELLPVDRAKRLDTGFQRHLAAHSECWAARTIGGIVPKAVLARISKDETDSYEHRVFARLLDYLENYLLRRIEKLASIGDRYEKGLNFANSASVDYRLRNDICSVWGEAVSQGDAGELLNRNRDQSCYLKRLLRRVLALKERRIKGLNANSLYHEIPRSAQVGLNLIATNLLQHDRHYRQLRQLWMAWLAVSAIERESPPQVFERQRNEQTRYERYVGLVLLRALKSLGFDITWLSSDRLHGVQGMWAESLHVTYHQHGWFLEMGGRRLTFVPVAAPLDDNNAGFWTTRKLTKSSELRIPCLLYAPQDQTINSPCDHLIPNSPGLRLSPLDLYAEEAMVTLLSAWFWQHWVSGYGEVFTKLPNAVANLWPDQGDGCETDRALLKPIEDNVWYRLEDSLRLNANQQLFDKVSERKKKLDILSSCPNCNQRAQLFDLLSGGFFALCSCGSRWGLRNGWFELNDSKQSDSSFTTLGRRFLRIYCNIS